MSYVADLGGLRGHGPINPEDNEPIFHEEWERKVCTLNMAIWFGGAWNADETRHSMETMNPGHYLTSSYYEHWLHFMEDLLVKKGVVTPEELAAGHLISSGIGSSIISKVAAEQCWPGFQAGGSTALPLEAPRRFSEGELVRCINANPIGHTRLPRYARGKRGVVISYRGSFDFADTRAHGVLGQAQHLYAVRFEGGELWGVDAGRKDAVFLDLFESYLEPAQ
ncbi:nitrile hydratase subunit beta [Pseudomonas sp. NPDC089752]|uniref:nitrile hydratase subunit beta n=1 Tax=Pseudomonas sp. NPDC089752 TaxID=3364472 RepID=UPI00382C7CA6